MRDLDLNYLQCRLAQWQGIRDGLLHRIAQGEKDPVTTDPTKSIQHCNFEATLSTTHTLVAHYEAEIAATVRNRMLEERHE